jgi:hypothetical protein
MKRSCAIAFASDMSLSASFCRDAMGLPLRYETREWSEFASDGATFALHAGKGPAPNANAGKAPGRCQPGFSVRDLTASPERTVGAGVARTRSPRDAFDVAIARYERPDGLDLWLNETRGSHGPPGGG